MAAPVAIFGCSWDKTNFAVLCVLLLRSILSFLFALPGKWPVCCTGSNLTSLCGVVRFATCPTGCINSFWFSVCSLNVYIVVVRLIVVVAIRVVGSTVFVSRKILFFQLFHSVFLTSDTDFFNVLVCTEVERWLRSVSFCVCGIFAHSVYL